jgi:antitoxin VapB
MNSEHQIVLFRNGRNRGALTPTEFELPGAKAIMRNEGASPIIEPVARRSLVMLLAMLTPIADYFPDLTDPRPAPVEL